MSETRAAYNVAMSHPEAPPEVPPEPVEGPVEGLVEGPAEGQPGRELDALVARVMGQSVTYTESYSEEDEPAMRAWAWLEENHPWGGQDTLCLGRFDNKPSVFVFYPATLDWATRTIATGITYPHAIALAVVEAGKALGAQNESA